MNFRKQVGCLLVLAFFLPVTLLAKSPESDSLVFAVMGDVPRSPTEDIVLQKQIEEHNKLSHAEFMVHVGDIKAGREPCDEAVYRKVAGYLLKLDIPVFIVPGDNEWNDCDDPQVAWTYWQKYFMNFENHWQNIPQVVRQEKRPENFAFIRHNVLVMGINLVGGWVFDQAIWDSVLQDDAEWVEKQFAANAQHVGAAVVCAQANPKEKHRLFMKRFLSAAKKFAKPILFIHGDGHFWLYDDPWQEPNIVRVQIDKGGIAPPVQVIVNPAAEWPFRFNRTLFPQPKADE